MARCTISRTNPNIKASPSTATSYAMRGSEAAKANKPVAAM
jgi:hypothetical protein